MIILVGITDTESKEKEAYILLKNIIPVLYENYNNNKILFHCFAGMSRSVMLAIAYLSYSMNITTEEAHQLVKEKRKFIEVNQGFLSALKRFEKE
jgi:protein-tyrosine phosphatase